MSTMLSALQCISLRALCAFAIIACSLAMRYKNLVGCCVEQSCVPLPQSTIIVVASCDTTSMLIAVILVINIACCCHLCKWQHVYYLIVASSHLAVVGLLSLYAPWQYDCFSQHQKYYVVTSLAMRHQGYACCCCLCAQKHIMFDCYYVVGHAIPSQLSLILTRTLARGRMLSLSWYDEKGTDVVAFCNITYNIWLLRSHHTFTTCPHILCNVQIFVVYACSLAMQCKKCACHCLLIAVQHKEYNHLRPCFLRLTVKIVWLSCGDA